ncbi:MULTISPECIES: hypothetical protein [unclassified Streptomyces]|uniref:hypothetical protein n=1 Tax=unclassified Streptomyces TaxID=2593676 RepID=UPI0033C5415C
MKDIVQEVTIPARHVLRGDTFTHHGREWTAKYDAFKGAWGSTTIITEGCGTVYISADHELMVTRVARRVV